VFVQHAKMDSRIPLLKLPVFLKLSVKSVRRENKMSVAQNVIKTCVWPVIKAFTEEEKEYTTVGFS